MGHCGGTLNCTARESINVTADIAGNGVLVAFLLSALMTIVAIVIGYISDSLPEDYLNETDQATISLVRSCISRLWPRAIWSKLSKYPVHFFRPNEALKPRRKLLRREREEAVTRFILALSDQQLATGLAVLVASVSNQCVLSLYEWRIAFCLAWFSSITHLATLDSLQQYFYTHRMVRIFRVIGMVSLMILLVYAFAINMSGKDPTIPAECAFIHYQISGSDLLFTDTSGLFKLIVVCNLGATAVYPLITLLMNYNIRVQRSYLDLKRPTLPRPWVLRLSLPLELKVAKKDLGVTETEFVHIQHEYIAETRASRHRNLLELVSERERGSHKRRLLILFRAFASYKVSFLSQCSDLIFMLSYGISRLCFTRWGKSEIVVNVDSTMNLGQVIPLFLLVIPIFAAAEVYNEAQVHTRLNDTGEKTGVTKADTEDSTTTTHQEMSALSRVETLPLTTSDDLEHPECRALEEALSKYDSMLPDIEKFYRREVKIINDKIMAATTEAETIEMLKVRKELITTTANLIALENELKPTFALGLVVFAFDATFNIAFGVLLNYDFENDDISISTFAVSFFGLFYFFVIRAYMTSSRNGANMSLAFMSPENFRRLVKEARPASGL